MEHKSQENSKAPQPKKVERAVVRRKLETASLSSDGGRREKDQ